MRRGLRTRGKLVLIDGRYLKPHESMGYYEDWLKGDYTISQWIFYSISDELVNAFSHSKLLKDYAMH